MSESPVQYKLRWQAIRRAALEQARGICSASGCGRPATDVIAWEGRWGAFCRSCRCLKDGPVRAAKAAHTRAFRQAQLTLFQAQEPRPADEDELARASTSRR